MASCLDILLDPKHVDLNLGARTKSEALRKLVDLIASPVGDPDKFFEQVIEREDATSTLAEHGIAFPHARTSLVREMVLAIGRSGNGVPFGPRGEPARLIFLIAVPQRLVTEYLICVGTLARALNDNARRQALLRVETAEEFIAELRQVESI